MNLSPVLRQRFFDANGLPLAGGLLYSYLANTTTPTATFSNSTGTTNANPVVLDANGYADLWLDPTIAYKFILNDSGGSLMWSVDGVTFPIGITTWSSNTVYSQGAVVVDPNGQLYVSLTNGNTNNAITNVSSWRMFEGNIRTVSTNTTLAVTDNLVRSNSTSGNLTHTLPACSTTPIGKEITVKDVGTGGNTTTVKGAGTDLIDAKNTYIGKIVRVKNNGTSWDCLDIPDGAVTQDRLAPLGQQLSASSGNTGTSSASFADITNASVTITTTGRPVYVGLIPDGSSNAAFMGFAGNSNDFLIIGTAQFLRNTDVVGVFSLALSAARFAGTGDKTFYFPPSVIHTIDTPAAGTYTYKLQCKSNAGTLNVEYIKLVAFEL